MRCIVLYARIKLKPINARIQTNKHEYGYEHKQSRKHKYTDTHTHVHTNTLNMRYARFGRSFSLDQHHTTALPLKAHTQHKTMTTTTATAMTMHLHWCVYPYFCFALMLNCQLDTLFDVTSVVVLPAYNRLRAKKKINK